MESCQSCHINAVEVVDDCDHPAFPYKLCKACHHRLQYRCLRPREYFNLVSQHGVTYLLHDDFYEEDGTASQPKREVANDENLTFPMLNQLHDIKSLVDYAIVEWWLSEKVVDKLKQFETKEILAELKKRMALNEGLAARLYDIAAKVLGLYADEWIISQWQQRTPENFPIYAEALAACLEEDHGFQLYNEALKEIEQPSRLSETMRGLIYFQSKLGLQWIEDNAHRVTNFSNSWGLVAVASQFDWPTAKKWLTRGRPLSLIALDALSNCAVTAETLNSTLWLREHPQRLLAPASIDEMNSVLRNYLEKDSVARVRTNINYITIHWPQILK